MTSGLRQAVGFLTPVGGASAPSPAALPWFPFVGMGVGLGLGGVWETGDRLWTPLLVAAVVVAADLAATGMLHLDGLVDSADGLLPHLSPERRLEVMRQPDAGAFGVGVAVSVLMLRWATLAAVAPSPLLLGALWCFSRTGMAAATLRLPYARSGGGLATAFRPSVNERRPGRVGVALVAGAVVAFVAATAWDVVRGPAALVAAALGSSAVLALAQRRIGGFTGDVLGAAGMVGETCGLLAAATTW